MKFSVIKCKEMDCNCCPLNGEVCQSFTESTLEYTLGQMATMYGRRLLNRVDQEYHSSDTAVQNNSIKQQIDHYTIVTEIKQEMQNKNG